MTAPLLCLQRSVLHYSVFDKGVTCVSALISLLLYTHAYDANAELLHRIMNNDSESARHAKRARTDVDDAPPLAPTRSDIWFEDGNVVLQAENTQFRVHRGVLTKSSEVFRDMFAIPQPATVDECPLVHLADTAEQVQWVLKALYGDRKCVDFVRYPLAWRG